VKEHRPGVNGRTTWFWCAQDESRKRKSKKQHAPAVKNRDTEGMDRFACDSHLRINIRRTEDQKRQKITVCLEHSHNHVPYYDVSLPACTSEFIKENIWSAPSVIASKICDEFPHITRQQVYAAWSKYSEMLWKRADDQLESAKELLLEMTEEADIFQVDTLDGVVALGWGLPMMASRLKGKIVEVAIDATCSYVIFHCFSFINFVWFS